MVDGQIGGTPEMALDNFKDVTRTWIRTTTSSRPGSSSIGRCSNRCRTADQQALVDAAQEATTERFAEIEKADQPFLQEMRDAGIQVVDLDEATLEEFARVTGEEVWPEIEGEVGEEIMARLRSALTD